MQVRFEEHQHSSVECWGEPRGCGWGVRCDGIAEVAEGRTGLAAGLQV